MHKASATILVLLACGVLAACPEAAPPSSESRSVEAPPPSDAQPAFVGTWAADAAGCAIPQEQGDAPHVFGPDNYDQHEAHCTYANVAQTGPNSWHIDAACQVEGDEASLGWDLTVEGDAMTMDGTHRFVRCP